MSNWTQIRVACATEDLETVSAVMSMFDNNLMIEDPRDLDDEETITCYGGLIDEELEKTDRSRGAVSIYEEEGSVTPEILEAIKALLAASSISFDLSLVGRKEEDWRDVWKKYYRPVKISPTVTVVPLWEDYTPAEGEKIIRMDPGVAFGSGTHETTRLCAQLIEKHMNPGDTLLDVGTGSGILAISAAILGAKKVRAYDIDPIAVRVAGENVAQNGVSDRVECAPSDLLRDVDLSEGQYDFISANIVADIILRMAPDVSRYMKKGGKLAVSGIIDRQAAQVKEALEAQGLTLADSLTENDWNSMLFVK